MNIILPIITSLIPVLVQQAEGLFTGSNRGAEKRDWVVGVVNTLARGLEKQTPGWAAPIEEAMKPLVETAIETALTALKL